MHTLSSDPAMGTWVLQIRPTKGVAIPIYQHFWTWSMLRQKVWIVQRGDIFLRGPTQWGNWGFFIGIQIFGGGTYQGTLKG